MYIYLCVMLVSLFFAYFAGKVRASNVLEYRMFHGSVKKKQLEIALLFVSAGVMILFSGLRYKVGADYEFLYVPLYSQIKAGMSWKESNIEPLFYLLYKLLIGLNAGTVFLFLITSAIIIGLFWVGFYQQSNDVFMSILLFFCIESYFTSLCYVRQFISLAIVFYAFKYINKREFWKYAICVILACGFHYSAIMFLPLYIFSKIKLKPIVFVISFISLAVLQRPLVAFMAFCLKNTKYGYYIGSDYISGNPFYLSKFLLYLMVFAFALVLYKKNRKNPMFHVSFAVLVILLFLTSHFDIFPQLDRVRWALEIVILYLLPRLFSQIKHKTMRNLVVAGVLIAFAMVTHYNVDAMFAHGVIPYRLVFAPDLVIV